MKVRLIPKEFNASFNDVCAGADSWTTVQGVPTICSLSNGLTSGAQQGVAQGSVSGNGCNNWSMTWSQTGSSLYYVDRYIDTGGQVKNVAFQLFGTDFGWTFGGYTHDIAGDSWEIYAVLKGVGKSSTSGAGYSADPFILAGTAFAAGSNCDGGTRPTELIITSLTGSAVITR